MSVLRRCPSILEKSAFDFAEILETTDDDQLVAAAKDGNRDAFGTLVKRHKDKLFHTTLRITRNREDAEDAVQESFVSALVHLVPATTTPRQQMHPRLGGLHHRYDRAA